MPTNAALKPLAAKLRRQKGVMGVPWPDRDLVPAWRAFNTFDGYALVVAFILINDTPLQQLDE